MNRRLIMASLLILLLMAGCIREEEYAEPESFRFVVYPGARYLKEISEIVTRAHELTTPDQDPPPVAVYDTDASLEEVAAFYTQSYGYGGRAAEQDGRQARVQTRSGDLAADNREAAALMKRLNLATDVSRAAGNYRAVDLRPQPNLPAVTIQRPYFDVTTSRVVDRTLILMAR